MGEDKDKEPKGLDFKGLYPESHGRFVKRDALPETPLPVERPEEAMPAKPADPATRNPQAPLWRNVLEERFGPADSLGYQFTVRSDKPYYSTGPSDEGKNPFIEAMRSLHGEVRALVAKLKMESFVPQENAYDMLAMVIPYKWDNARVNHADSYAARHLYDVYESMVKTPGFFPEFSDKAMEELMRNKPITKLNDWRDKFQILHDICLDGGLKAHFQEIRQGLTHCIDVAHREAMQAPLSPRTP